jgi:hypothetical protein
MSENFSLPDQTIQIMQELKKSFGVTSNAEVISRALGLARIVAGKADDQNSVVVIGKDEPVKLTLTE